MATINEFTNSVSALISTIKHSIERSIPFGRGINLNINEISSFIGEIEVARFKFNSNTRYGTRTVNIDEDLISSLKILLDDLRSIMSNRSFQEYSRSCTFRLQAPYRDRSQFLASIEPRFFERISVFEAAIITIDLVEKVLNSGVPNFETAIQATLPISSAIQSPIIAASELKRIVPGQKIAPIKFRISNDRIFLEKTTSSPGTADRENVIAAKEELIDSGQRIFEQLKASNCDKRLIESLETLQVQITSNSNIVQIGMSNVSLGTVADAFKAELPDAVSAMLQAHTINVGMYVAQFPEWNRFAENAALVELDVSDIEIVKDSSNSIDEYIRSNPDISENEVRSTFRRISDLVRNPGNTSKRAAFAVVRSIENLLSEIFKYAILFLEQTAKETVKKAAKRAAEAIVILAISHAGDLSSLSSKVKELSWVKNAIEIVERQFKDLQ